MKYLAAVALSFWIGSQTMAEPAPKPPFKAGAATSNITPFLGEAIIGGFVPFPATHVHDDLYAKCLVLDDGKTRLAVVVCDLLGIHVDLSREARKLIHQSVGIPPEQVLISATHTHSATSALGSNRLSVSAELDEYQQFVARRIADGVARAVNTLRPAEIGFATTQAPQHVFNRRWFMKEGTLPPNPFGGTDRVKMNPPGGSPDLIEPAGPTDPEIPIVAVREPDGRPIAVFSIYSLHYIGGVGPGHISADYYGMYCRELERLLGAERQEPPFVALMANGTSGDINNINFRQPRPRKEPYEQMRFVADDVARKVHQAMEKIEYRDSITLAAAYREPTIAWRRPTEEQLQWAKKTIEENPTGSAKGNLPVIYAERTLRMADYPEASPIPVQVFRIGDVCLGTIPCEVLCEIGLEFKERSPLKPAYLVSLAHGYLGYLPPPRQHELGGYETWLGTSRLEPQASVLFLDALVEMAADVGKSGAK